jgi:hypothetical protein
MPSRTRSIFLGGVVAAVIAVIFSVVQIPFLSGCMGCLAYLAAGLVAVWHYAESHTLTVLGGTGAGMGAGAGVVAGVVVSLLTFALWTTGLIPSPTESIEQAIATGVLPAGQAEAARGIVGSPAFYVGYAVLFAVIGAIFGAIGGAIGASVFERGGDTPDGGPGTNGGPGGPRSPAGDRPQAGGPQQARTPPPEEAGTRRSGSSESGSSEEYRPRPEEGAATPPPE